MDLNSFQWYSAVPGEPEQCTPLCTEGWQKTMSVFAGGMLSSRLLAHSGFWKPLGYGSNEIVTPGVVWLGLTPRLL